MLKLLLRVSLLAASLTVATQVRSEDGPDALTRFLIANRCTVVDHLMRVHDFGDPKDEMDRYLVVSLHAMKMDGYAQCLFHDTNGMVYCELESGFYRDVGTRKMYLPAEAVKAVGALGFSTDDSKGNFLVDLKIGNPPDYQAIADLMLKSLYVGYGARDGMKLKYEAPFAPAPSFSCTPNS